MCLFVSELIVIMFCVDGWERTFAFENEYIVCGFVLLLLFETASLRVYKFVDCLWLDPPWFNRWFSLALARSVDI